MANQLLIGTIGDDVLTGGTGNDTLLGGAGNDRLVITTGNDIYDGGLGFDVLDGSLSGVALTINLAAGTMSGPGVSVVSGIESVIGSSKADTITGSLNADVISGGSGNDQIYGGAGNDQISGDAGDDTIDGQDGNDTISGGDGSDQLTGGAGDDVINGDAGNDSIDGGDGNDTIHGGTGADTMFGSAGDDTIYTDSGNDIIDGGDGRDRLFGGSGSDQISGGLGDDYIEGGDNNDTLRGGDGNDTLVAGSGNDRLFGDAGSDTLVYDVSAATGYNQVFDGGAGTDTLEVHLTRAQLTSAVQTELDKFQTFISNAANAGKTFKFTTLGNLQVTNVEKLTVVVDDANTAPVIDANQTTSSLTVAHSHAVSGQIVATDANGDTLAYSVSSAAQHGTVTLTDTAGHYTYTAGDYVGSDSFTIQVSDGHGGVTTQTVNVGVTNAGPVVDAGNTTSALTVAHGHTASGQVVATDADGDSVSYSVGTAAQHGTVTLTDAAGHYTYTAGDYVGSDSFTIQVSDGHGGVTTQTVNVGVTNAGPVIDAEASTTSFLVGHDQSYSGQVAASDSDGDALTYTLTSAPQHGTLTFIDTAGHWVFQAIGAFDTDSFTVQVSDGHGGVSALTISVTDPNTAPVIDASSTSELSVAHNHTVSGTVAATDAENDALTYSVAAGPAHGTVTFTDTAGHFTYTAGDYIGADSFTVQVADGYGGVVEHTVTIGLTNTGPVIDTGLTTQSLIGRGVQPLSGVLVATDTDGDQLGYSVSTAQHGSVSLSGSAGGYTYVSDGLAGVDSFTVTASDGHGGTVQQVVSVSTIGTLVAAPGATAAMSVDLSAHTATNVAGDVNWAIDVSGSSYADRIIGDARANVLSGGAGNDTIAGGEGADTLDGGDGTDALNGGGGNDLIRGGTGNDGIYGGGANDRIYGNEGNDRIFGDGGDDVISGGVGNDTMTGGQSNGLGLDFKDTFAWDRGDVVSASGTSAGLDHITDFGVNDRLDFSGLFNNSHPANIASVVHVVDTAAGTVISADVGGGSFMDVVVLDNVHGVTIDDLLNNHQVVV